MSVNIKGLGLRKGSAAPSKIVNSQHHDPSHAARGLAGTPGVSFQVITTEAQTEVQVPDRSIVRVLPSASGQFIWIGDINDTPPATLDATNAIQLAVDDAETFHMGDEKKIKVSANVQVVLFE